MNRDPWSFNGIDADAPTISPRIRHEDRVCAVEGCGTLLSIYNASTFCWHHEVSRVFALPGPQDRSRRRREGEQG
jgi:hypothetical protein